MKEYKPIITVYFIGQPEMKALLANGLAKYPEINLCGGTDDFEQAKAHFIKHPGHIAIVQFDPDQPEPYEMIAGYLKSRDVKSIVLCRTMQQGFTLLNAGASDMITLKNWQEASAHASFLHNLVLRVKSVNNISYKKEDREYKLKTDMPYKKIIAIGASTGGTEATQRILMKLPSNAPPILVVQHMPPVFTKLYAERLHNLCQISVWEAQDKDPLRTGLALIAPGDVQMRLVNHAGKLCVACQGTEKVTGHCPSVNVLFHSVATVMKERAVGVILTGMGADGAVGLQQMRGMGAYTIGQNEESCIVYGMPKVANDLDAVCREEHIDRIADLIMAHI